MFRLRPQCEQVVTGGVVAVMLIASVGCDGVADARMKVVAYDGAALPDAVIRTQDVEEDASRFTNEKGCAHFRAVIGRSVRVAIGKASYQSMSLELRNAEKNCLLIHLARDGEQQKSSAEVLSLEGCPCAPNSGYSPTMSARFKVRDTNASEIGSVEIRRSNERPQPWAQGTNSKGCLGIRWIVSSTSRSVPLVLEKQGYQRAYVEVPTMKDLCYSVTLSGTGQPSLSTVAAIAADKCECEMFSGNNISTRR